MPDAGGANSGYLVQEGDFKLLVDCGTGVFAQLRTVCEPTNVDAVLITHLHADHMIDLLPYAHALLFVYRGAGKPLWGPPESTKTFAALSAIFGIGYQIHESFSLQEYDPDRSLQLGPLTVRFQWVPHYVPTWACDLQAPDGKRFTFGADCAPNDLLPKIALDTDLLMLEATERVAPYVAPDDIRGHMTAREAGELARACQARRLVLTHYSDLLDAGEVSSEGQGGFGAPVELAQAGMQLII